MEFEEFLDFSAFQNKFGFSTSQALLKAGQSIEGLTKEDLRGLVQLLYGKYARNEQRRILVAAAKRGLQARFYSQLYKHEPTEDVIQRNEESEKTLDKLEVDFDEAVFDARKDARKRHKRTRRKKKVEQVMEKTRTVVQEPRAPRQKKQKSEFGVKVSGMTLEELISWAQEIGVSEERIKKYQGMPKGLAKMNISNLVKTKLKIKS